MADGQSFYADEVVRIIPKRRLVAFGTWQGKPAVAKLFFDPQHAKRQMEADVRGVKTLLDYKVPTPQLYHQGKSKDERVYILIFERILDAYSLEDIWLHPHKVDDLLFMLKAVIVELATQHVLGVLQKDLHLKNFLLTEKTIYTLDGAQVELFPHLMPKKQSLHNLALFLAQFGVGVEALQEKLLLHYAKSRGWLLKKEDISELFLTIKKWNRQRWEKFEKKIFRECTPFACLETWQAFGMYDRKYVSPEFLNFLQHPEQAFKHPTAVLLKNGRSATVIKVQFDHRTLVIKRYNLKNIWHRLRRCLRPTRASTSWRLAQKLNLFGVKTAKPVAFIEKKWLGLRGKSYYVTEYISGEHIGDYFQQHQTDESQITAMIKHIITLLKNIAKLEITHGDLKMTNILIDQEKQPVLIDLDGAAEHVSLSSLRSAWRKEIKRFLANFSHQPALLEKFKTELAKK